MSPQRKIPAERKVTCRAKHRTRRSPYSNGRAKVNPNCLVPKSSYSDPDFLERGYYVD